MARKKKVSKSRGSGNKIALSYSVMMALDMVRISLKKIYGYDPEWILADITIRKENTPEEGNIYKFLRFVDIEGIIDLGGAIEQKEIKCISTLHATNNFVSGPCMTEIRIGKSKKCYIVRIRKPIGKRMVIDSCEEHDMNGDSFPVIAV